MDLALTLDYELYGNGQGDVCKQIIEPTNMLLEVCERYNAKITLFFEVVEYWKHRETYLSGQTMGYAVDPAKLMEDQIIDAYKRGHDIQLHIHPQWIEAKYANGEWNVNFNLWRLPQVPAEPSNLSGTSLKKLLKKGKDTVESLIKPIDPNYECTILRAGGLNMYPSTQVLRAMRDIGLSADSSVFPGGFSQTKYAYYDYRMVPYTLPYWSTYTDDILSTGCNDNDSRGNIYELPVFALPMRRFRKYDIVRLKSKLKNKAAVKTTLTQAETRMKNQNRVKYFFEKESVAWDYCLFSYRKMKFFLSKAREIHDKSSYDYHPFILIGHSKEFSCPANLTNFLRYVQNKQYNVDFVTLAEVSKKIVRR